MGADWLLRGAAVAFRDAHGDLQAGRFSHMVELSSGVWLASVVLDSFGTTVGVPLEEVEVVACSAMRSLEELIG